MGPAFDGSAFAVGRKLCYKGVEKWLAQGKRTSAAKTALQRRLFGTAEAVPLSKTECISKLPSVGLPAAPQAGNYSTKDSFHLGTAYRDTALLCGLLREISDERKLVSLPFACLEHDEYPEDQKCKPHWNHQNPSENRNDSEHKVDSGDDDPQQNGLPGMEANKRTAVIRSHDEKDDRGNDGNVSDHTGSSLRE